MAGLNDRLLEQIENANDIKKIPKEDYPALAEEIREFLIEKISVTCGGAYHGASCGVKPSRR